MSERIFMETTRIDVKRTVNEIQELLSGCGAGVILLEYQSGKVSALSFKYQVGDQLLPFRLPCRWELMMERLKETGRNPKSDDSFEEWARRVAWRQILRWVQAQMALVETRMVKIEEVFFPYIQTRSGQTIFELQSGKNFALLGSGK